MNRRFLLDMAMVVIGFGFIIFHVVSKEPNFHFFGVAFIALGLIDGSDLFQRMAGYTSQLSVKDWFVFRFREQVETVEDLKGEKATLEPSVVDERRRVASKMPLPDRNAPPFSLIDHHVGLKVIPRTDPTVPMYFLDNNYRIVDWNQSFSLAFDRTMEGRRGMSVSEWIFFLANYVEVLKHGTQAFADPNNLPQIDVETIQYTSRNYGSLSAIKRAYQVPKDEGGCLGWLTTLELSFNDEKKAEQFDLDLIRLLHMDLVWSEYSLVYDPVLNNTYVYPELLETLLGERGALSPIPAGATVLDLGAGTGNLTVRLADPTKGRLVFALENNDAMLKVLQRKCQSCLRSDNDAPGVIAIKQDVASLFGLPDNYFSCTMMNNVSYALEDPVRTFRQVYQALKPGGELRLSGPQKSTNLGKLLRTIRRDLEKKGMFQELESQYRRLEAINTLYLTPILHQWNIDDVKGQLSKAGFSEITYTTDKAYAGQSMIVCARK